MIRLSKETATYTFSGGHPPAIRVQPGEAIVFETLDALDDQIHSDEDSASKIDLDHVNAATGPVYVEGAKPGDTLVAEILDIRPWDWGAALIIPGFGFLQDTIPGPYTKVFRVEEDGLMHYGDKIRLPLKPMVGTIGVAPLEPITTLSSGAHGGNLDTTDIKIGCRVYLPVFVRGAYLLLGDVHAAQGDGEIGGSAVETTADVTIEVGLRKGEEIRWPRFENADYVMTTGSARPLIDAFRIAHVELIDWLARDYGFDRLEALQAVTQVGTARIGNVVDPNYTIVAKFPKEYLPL